MQISSVLPCMGGHVVNPNGGYNIEGVADFLCLTGLPRTCSLTLAVRVEDEAVSTPQDYRMMLVVIDPDGKSVFEYPSELVLRTPAEVGDNHMAGASFTINLEAVTFNTYGTHRFDFYVNGALEYQLPLRILPQGSAPLEIQYGTIIR